MSILEEPWHCEPEIEVSGIRQVVVKAASQTWPHCICTTTPEVAARIVTDHAAAAQLAAALEEIAILRAAVYADDGGSCRLCLASWDTEASLQRTPEWHYPYCRLRRLERAAAPAKPRQPDDVTRLRSAMQSVLTGEYLGEAVHTALRKFSDHGREAHRVIAEMPDGDWPETMDVVATVLIEDIERAAIRVPAAPAQPAEAER